LDVRGNRELEWLACSKNEISTLTLGDKPKLEHLNCMFNELTEVDLSGTRKSVLKYFYDKSVENVFAETDSFPRKVVLEPKDTKRITPAQDQKKAETGAKMRGQSLNTPSAKRGR
jgi:Leucine-rich repeat (LRR) protein